MTVVEGTSGTYRSRVDGTIVLSVEIEPRHARAALELFGMPGQPLALAALKINGAASESKSAQAGSTVASGQYDAAPPSKRTVGPICTWLAMRCKEPEFQVWLVGSKNEAATIERCREACGVQSRADIDGNPQAEAWFKERIQKPYAKSKR